MSRSVEESVLRASCMRSSSAASSVTRVAPAAPAAPAAAGGDALEEHGAQADLAAEELKARQKSEIDGLQQYANSKKQARRALREFIEEARRAMPNRDAWYGPAVRVRVQLPLQGAPDGDGVRVAVQLASSVIPPPVPDGTGRAELMELTLSCKEQVEKAFNRRRVAADKLMVARVITSDNMASMTVRCPPTARRRTLGHHHSVLLLLCMLAGRTRVLRQQPWLRRDRPAHPVPTWRDGHVPGHQHATRGCRWWAREQRPLRCQARRPA